MESKEYPSWTTKVIVLALICIMNTNNYFGYHAPSANSDQYETIYKLTPQQFGTLFTIYSAPNIILAFFSGIVIDRYGIVNASIVSNILILIGVSICAITPIPQTENDIQLTYTTLLIGRLFLGLGGESIVACASTAIAKWFTKDNQINTALSINQAFVQLFGSSAAFYYLPRLHTLQHAQYFTVLICSISFIAVLMYTYYDQAYQYYLNHSHDDVITQAHTHTHHSSLPSYQIIHDSSTQHQYHHHQISSFSSSYTPYENTCNILRHPHLLLEDDTSSIYPTDDEPNEVLYVSEDLHHSSHYHHITCTSPTHFLTTTTIVTETDPLLSMTHPSHPSHIHPESIATSPHNHHHYYESLDSIMMNSNHTTTSPPTSEPTSHNTVLRKRESHMPPERSSSQQQQRYNDQSFSLLSPLYHCIASIYHQCHACCLPVRRCHVVHISNYIHNLSHYCIPSALLQFSPLFWLTTLHVATLSPILYTFTAFGPLYLKDNFITFTSEQVAADAISLLYVGIVFAPFSGYIIDRIGHRIIIQFFATLCILLLFILLQHNKSMNPYYSLLFMGMLFSITEANSLAIVSYSVSADILGQAYGLDACFISIALLLEPTVVGYQREVTGSFATSIHMFIFLISMSTILCICMYICQLYYKLEF